MNPWRYDSKDLSAVSAGDGMFNPRLPRVRTHHAQVSQKDTSRRYQSVSELVVDLRNFGSTMHGERDGDDVTQT